MNILFIVSIVILILSYIIKEAWDPPFIVESVLTPEECKQIIEKATPHFKRSEVISENPIDDVRTSETAWISKTDPLAQKVLLKACQITGKKLEHCEDLQVVKYGPGNQYKAHHDACVEGDGLCTKMSGKTGQRIGTLLVYLNNDFTEGETDFPTYGKKFKPSVGSAVFFRPLGKFSGEAHPKALHAGLPVGEGTKYVCNAWVRQKY